MIFRNISTPVTTHLRVSRIPTRSTSSDTFTLPLSTRPVATVPRPVIENTSSTGIRNGLSRSRFGSGTELSTASISSQIALQSSESGSSDSSAFKALPRITGTSSPGNSYFDNSSRISSSTRSSSSASSTMSTLFMNTTMYGTPT